eukprot:scaffold1459_cov183-Chaetoceros_neogracile.AAC.12
MRLPRHDTFVLIFFEKSVQFRLGTGFGTFILRLNDTFFFEKSVQFRLGTGFGTKSPCDSCAVAL